jgi:hypothetical protein
VLTQARILDCPGNTGCNPSLICYNNQLCWHTKDVVCYSLTDGSDVLTTSGNVTFPASGNNLVIFQCSSYYRGSGPAPAGNFSPSTGAYTVPRSGIYRISASASVTGTVALEVRSPPGTKLASIDGGIGTSLFPVSVLFVGPFAAGDMIAVYFDVIGGTPQCIRRVVSFEQL